MDNIQKVKEIISENIYITIASASLEGKPWISPVFFAYDDRYNLFWVSNKDAMHSSLIRNNPHIAIVIFDSKALEGKGDAVYMEAHVSELENEEDITHAIEVLNKRVTKDEFKVKKTAEVTREGVWRIYKATPTKVYKLAEGKYINGQYVDSRVEIELL